MPKKKPENKLTDKEQFERFKKTARELGIDEEENVLNKAFKKLRLKGKQNTTKKG